MSNLNGGHLLLLFMTMIPNHLNKCRSENPGYECRVDWVKWKPFEK